MYTRAITLSAGATPPREFQIFKAGLNSTAKGTFNFDEQAARQVMAAYSRAHVDLMLDLEHESLGTPLRADSADARGWFQLELRPDGSLWAVNVRYTPDGARRLQERTQRYISPAFSVDKDGRPTQIINAALTSMPATHGAQALVAAGKTARVSARLSPAARAQLYLLASKRKTTISALLLSALDTLAEAGTAAPTRDQVAALKAITSALGLPPETDAATIKSALSALLEATAPPEPSNSDALEAAPDPPPAQLSRAELAAMTLADRGRYHIEAAAARRARRAAGDKPLASNLATRKR